MIRQLMIPALAILITSCTARSYKSVIESFKDMPAADYSYVIQPTFKLSKEASEEKLKEVYNAEELVIGASGTHTYDKETKAQIKERFWLKSVILNSNRVTDMRNDEDSRVLAKEIAQRVLGEVKNLEFYDRVEIMLMQQWDDGQVKSMKRNFFFTVPNLELSTL